MSKVIITMLAMMIASVSMASLIVHDSFSDAASGSAVPAGWVASTPGTGEHSRIDTGSLSYAGLAASAGNSWGLGQGGCDYERSVSGITGLAAGDHVYYSFLMRLNSPLDAFNSGRFTFYNTAAPTASGLTFGFGTSDYTTGKMGFSLSSRQNSWGTTPGATLTKTAETYDAADTVYLIVLGYNRGANAAGSSVELWINPDSSSFGTTPPAATLSLASYQNATAYANEATWNSLLFFSSGSTSGVANWQVDEMRISTDWAGVVPAIPEPATVGMLGLGAAAVLMIRRFRNPRG